VVNTSCQPVARALIDFWQCDDAGVYDNVGYRLRGHQFTDEQGRYQLETIEPGIYPGRTRHIHVKVQAPNQPVLTTQLYFPNEPRNATDGIYRPECEIAVQDNGDGSKNGAFDFVLNL
jgi:protocatechuate 3,4-dioxygenase beta subunit